MGLLGDNVASAEGSCGTGNCWEKCFVNPLSQYKDSYKHFHEVIIIHFFGMGAENALF